VTDQEIEVKVIDIVSKQLNVEREKIKRETNFIADLNADSLDVVEMVMQLEDAFDTKIPDEQAEKLTTVGHAIEFIRTNLASKA
jgi:acyl carrier protein